jgi:hypothetical protein
MVLLSTFIDQKLTLKTTKIVIKQLSKKVPFGGTFVTFDNKQTHGNN